MTSEALAGAVPIDAQAAATPDQSIASSRLDSLDYIRGIAVLGILLSNILNYALPPGAHRWVELAGQPSVTDTMSWLVQYIFVDGKMRGIFALLFGAGLVLFMYRARARGAPAYWLQLRRLFWLALFGLAHFFFLFTGDIVFHYAVMGMAAIWLVRLPAKWLLLAGCLIYCADSALAGPDLWGWRQFEVAAMTAPEGAEVRQEYLAENARDRAEAIEGAEVLRTGSLPAIVRYRWDNHRAEPLEALRYVIFDGFAMMLVGAALYRMGLFSGAFDRRKLLRWGWIGIGVSAAASLALGLWLIAEGFPRALNMFVFYGPTHVTRLPMILGMVAVLVAMTPKWSAGDLGRRLSAAGRMAFTNYILTSSLVMAVIFQGWGLGLHGSFTRTGLWTFVLLGWGLMLVISPWWLARFRFGPLEWAWRCLTYWRLFPIRRR